MQQTVDMTTCGTDNVFMFNTTTSEAHMSIPTTPRPTYTRTSHVRIMRRADDSIAWYGVPDTTSDDDAHARFPDCTISVEVVVTDVSACDQVIMCAVDDARDVGAYIEGDEHILGLDMMRFLNSTPDAGRPSDAARTVTREYRADPVAYRARFATKRMGA